MSFQASVTLERLVCFSESDIKGTSHSEPYVWPYLCVLRSGNLESMPTVAALEETRRVIKYEMKANEAVYLPLTGNNRFTPTFEFGQDNRLILVVALLEADEMPLDVMRAAYQTYLTTLDEQLRARLGALYYADAASREAIIEEIKKVVKGRIKDTIKDKLSWTEELAVAWGSLNPDDFIAADSWYFERLEPTVFTLGFRGVSGDPRVILTGFRPLTYRIREYPVSFTLDCRLDVPNPSDTHGPVGGGVLER